MRIPATDVKYTYPWTAARREDFACAFRKCSNSPCNSVTRCQCPLQARTVHSALAGGAGLQCLAKAIPQHCVVLVECADPRQELIIRERSLPWKTTRHASR